MVFDPNNYNSSFKITIDGTKIDEDLVDFPTAIILSSGTGITNFDITGIFDSLTASERRLVGGRW